LDREIKLNLIVRLSSEAVPFLVGCGMINNIIHNTFNDISHLVGNIVFTVILFIVWQILHFSLLPNAMIILSAMDIRQVLIIKIGPWQIINKVNIIKWDDVYSFDRSLSAGYHSGYRIFGKNSLGRNSLIILNSALQTFNEDDRKFIINHLPDYKIEKRARKEIIRGNRRGNRGQRPIN
jgi:hypothetical protein